MSYIKFDKTKLINLEYSLSRELIRSNRSGAYAGTTIVNSNTRKYHGLLVVPQTGIDNNLHVLLGALDETVIQHDAEFNLGFRKYPGGLWQPKGHKYIRDFESDPIPSIIYRVGGVVLKRESLLATKEDQILLRYTLVDAHSPTTLRFSPFLLFRSVHHLSKANIFADSNYDPEKNGISMRLYSGYSRLYMQFSKEAQYVHFPNWYYNIEYIREQERGYEYSEDQFVPGYFELPIQKGESIVFAAGLKPTTPERLPALFNREIKGRIPRNNFENCLINSAQQFFVDRDGRSEIHAGFPWYGRFGRDTFMALPGLTLQTGNPKGFRSVMNAMVEEMNGPLFPHTGHGKSTTYHSIDAPLWFFWAVQQYTKHTADWTGAWKQWGKAMLQVIEGYKAGTAFNIRMNDLGLIEGDGQGVPLTWMDAVVDGKPVTLRAGMAVEVNALWYNALCYFAELAAKNDQVEPAKQCSILAAQVKTSFTEVFWNHRKRYLFDYVQGTHREEAIRPNQVIATSLPYTPLSNEQIRLILDLVKTVLLTPRGLRSLSPHHPDYKGDYFGNQSQRDQAIHQGTVWPWLSGHFLEGWLRIYGEQGLQFAKNHYRGFEDTIAEDGLGSISEVYEGNPPHRAGGAISQARSVAELLRIHGLLKSYGIRFEVD
jgi:predicted glycogen debranching enzyme